MNGRCRSLLLPVGLIFLATAARAETAELEPIKDNTLYEDDAGARSNGAGSFLFISRAAGSDLGRARRALMAFDVAGAVPAGATIVSAELTLNVSRTVSGSQTVTLHRVLADWGEGSSTALNEEGMGADAAPGDATWLHRFFDDVRWTTPGGDFVADASATRSVGAAASYAWGSTSQMVADVQAWLDAPPANFGWIVIGNEDTSEPTSKRFDSRENAASVRPRLRIEFDTGGEATPSATETPTASATATSVADTATPTPSAIETGTAAPTPSETGTPTDTAAVSTLTPSPSPTASDTPSATATPTFPAPCAGDCDRDGSVSVDEIVRGVEVALGRSGLADCELLDSGADGVRVDDLVRAVRNALGGCIE